MISTGPYRALSSDKTESIVNSYASLHLYLFCIFFLSASMLVSLLSLTCNACLPLLLLRCRVLWSLASESRPGTATRKCINIWWRRDNKLVTVSVVAEHSQTRRRIFHLSAFSATYTHTRCRVLWWCAYQIVVGTSAILKQMQTQSEWCDNFSYNLISPLPKRASHNIWMNN